jgi:hypothetical protein
MSLAISRRREFPCAGTCEVIVLQSAREGLENQRNIGFAARGRRELHRDVYAVSGVCTDIIDLARSLSDDVVFLWNQSPHDFRCFVRLPVKLVSS